MRNLIINSNSEDYIFINKDISINGMFLVNGTISGFYTKSEIKNFIKEHGNMFGFDITKSYNILEKLSEPSYDKIKIISEESHEGISIISFYSYVDDKINLTEAVVNCNGDILEWYNDLYCDSSIDTLLDRKIRHTLLENDEFKSLVKRIVISETTPKSVKERIHRKFRRKKKKFKSNIQPKSRVVPKKSANNDPY